MARIPLHPKYPERICWGCDTYCPADELACGNGTIRTAHPIELLGDDWLESSMDWQSQHDRTRSGTQCAMGACGSPRHATKATRRSHSGGRYDTACVTCPTCRWMSMERASVPSDLERRQQRLWKLLAVRANLHAQAGHADWLHHMRVLDPGDGLCEGT